MMIRKAMEKWLTARPQRRLDGMLWVSDLGYHPAKAMRRVLHGEMVDFNVDTRVKMQSGNALEADTEQAIRFTHSGVLTQFPLFDERWSGYADFVIGHGTDEVTIIEHKTGGDKWFDYKDSLPRSTHVCQLWLYGQLYEQMHGVKPKLMLFYRHWGEWAELEITTGETGVTAHGRVNGEGVTRHGAYHPHLLKQELESFYDDQLEPILPEKESDWEYAEKSHFRLSTEAGEEYWDR